MYSSTVTQKLHTSSNWGKTDSPHVWIYTFDTWFKYAAVLLCSQRREAFSTPGLRRWISILKEKHLPLEKPCEERSSGKTSGKCCLKIGTDSQQHHNFPPSLNLSTSTSSLVKSQTVAWRTCAECDPLLIHHRQGKLERTDGWKAGRRRWEGGEDVRRMEGWEEGRECRWWEEKREWERFFFLT